jgi:uncharacterized membrane protein YraQ (UPF0718 family)/copper chaperone CopZ
MQYITLFFQKLFTLVLDMAPWLLLGFLIAGILNVFFPQGKINRLLGSSTLRSVFRAALIGIPLPLCSCGVIPTGISIHKNGASKGAAVSFLISTPQTGVDSIMVTYSLLGLPFAVIRPIVALITGIFGGALTNKFEPPEENIITEKASMHNDNGKRKKNTLRDIFRYAYVEFLEDIAKWLVIGLLVAALIAVFIPDDFFASYIHNDLIGMLIILAASIPIYVCATSSVPIAAVLILKGVSPGAALVFLMAGPATNAATISVIGNSMGRKTLILYLATLIFGAFLSGLAIDHLLPREWFTAALHHMNTGHRHTLLPYPIHLISGFLITLFIMNVYLRRWIRKIRNKKSTEKNVAFNMKEIKIYVGGMTCNHCKMTIENNLKEIEGIDTSVADIRKGTVALSGNNIDLGEVQEVIENIGYIYGGKVSQE